MQANSSTSGASFTQTTDIIHTFHSDSIAEPKVSGGDSTCVGVHYRAVPCGKLIALVCAVVLSERIVSRVKMCDIRSEIYGASDHCPVVLEIAPAAES